MIEGIIAYLLTGWLIGLIFFIIHEIFDITSPDEDLDWMNDFESHLFLLILYWPVYLICLIIRLL